MDNQTIPDIIVSRLPHYLQILERLSGDGSSYITSVGLAQKTHISAAQIRKDLSYFGGFGIKGTGYNIQFLTQQIRKCLNLDQTWPVVLVGAGDLGRALIHFKGLAVRGFVISRVFDNDPAKIWSMVASSMIEDAAGLVKALAGTNIHIAIITTPANAAQAVAEQIVQAGIRAILCYAPVILDLPSEIQVQYIDPLLMLQHMAYYL
jgi:redox-sensing transcriptional repressor